MAAGPSPSRRTDRHRRPGRHAPRRDDRSVRTPAPARPAVVALDLLRTRDIDRHACRTSHAGRARRRLVEIRGIVSLH
ncbi:hypothetical protein BTIS_0074 [Bifidobacterium tissieri]|uniref:Uncharacterized protein n=1 Tax=Bifidobacterium tissieri TaxID=1630162 RepID=A0A261FK45_9BIFI|nr:hypothetical protein BTIS_0074 [Bifidobacterium tissieri]